MIAGLLALLLAAGDTTCRVTVSSDSTSAAACVVGTAAAIAVARPDTAVGQPSLVAHVPRVDLLSAIPAFQPAADTVRKKRPLIAYSDWYGRRLAIHRTLSWAMIPLFAASYVTGDRLLRDGRSQSPYWVRATHPWAASATAGVFGINTVTGLWNLWDARHDPEGRTRRIIHSLMFVAADAGFAYAGSIGEQARNDGVIRARHRKIALSSMGVSTASWLFMLLTK